MYKHREIFLYLLRKEVGEIITDIRLAKGLKQDELAYMCGISLRTLVKIEGGSGDYAIDKYFLLSIALNKELAEIIKLARDKWEVLPSNRARYEEHRKKILDNMEARFKEYRRQEKVRKKALHDTKSLVGGDKHDIIKIKNFFLDECKMLLLSYA